MVQVCPNQSLPKKDLAFPYCKPSFYILKLGLASLNHIQYTAAAWTTASFCDVDAGL